MMSILQCIFFTIKDIRSVLIYGITSNIAYIVYVVYEIYSTYTRTSSTGACPRVLDPIVTVHWCQLEVLARKQVLHYMP